MTITEIETEAKKIADRIGDSIRLHGRGVSDEWYCMMALARLIEALATERRNDWAGAGIDSDPRIRG